jgi:5-methylcytosine-specific restriction endonuclease McrA
VTVAADRSYRRLYATALWRRTSALVIARAAGMCETRGCTNPATTADHVIPAVELYETGRLALFFDLSNLQAACRQCNSRRGARLVNGRRHSAVVAERAAVAWARQYEADQARLARERQQAWPEPRIF